MELIAKIRAEIERLMCPEIQYSMEQLLSFLDTLEESKNTYDTQQYTPRPSVGIEDVARVQFATHAKVFDKKRKAVFDWNQFKEVAGIFYGFGKKDTLESEKPINQEGLEEEITRTYHDGSVADTSEMDHVDYENIARHFAQWGADHTPLPEDTVLFNKGVEEGKRLMMEEAVEAKIYGYGDGSFELIASWLDMPNNSIYKDGDKVRVIVLKY